MRLISKQLLLASLLGLLITAVPAHLNAQSTDSVNKEGATSRQPASSSMRPIPFRGKLTSVDKIGRTITVGARIFRITSDTKLCKGASKLPATLSDGVTGEQVTGSYIKEADGKLIARSVYFGTRAPSKGEEKTQPKGTGTKQ